MKDKYSAAQDFLSRNRKITKLTTTEDLGDSLGGECSQVRAEVPKPEIHCLHSIKSLHDTQPTEQTALAIREAAHPPRETEPGE